MHVKPIALLVAAFLLAGTGLLAIAGDAKDAAVKKDRKALQGTWKTDKDNMAGIIGMRFEGEKFTLTFNGQTTGLGLGDFLIGKMSQFMQTPPNQTYMSEAYFGTNDFFPFVRAEIRQHDPQMYEVLQKSWARE